MKTLREGGMKTIGYMLARMRAKYGGDEGQANPRIAFDALETELLPILDLVPIEGTRSAVPKERWEAFVCRMAPELSQGVMTRAGLIAFAEAHDINADAWWVAVESLAVDAATALLGGEVLPVEAVFDVVDDELPSRVADGHIYRVRPGDRIALIADGEENT